MAWASATILAASLLFLAIGRPKPGGEEGTIAHIPAWVQIVPTVMAVALILESF